MSLPRLLAALRWLSDWVRCIVPAQAAPARLPSLPCSLPSRASDPLLSYISSALASRLQPAPRSAGSPAASGELLAAAAQWEVVWHELAIERAIGRGSYGWVYLAHWRRTPVAVKVLVNIGACKITRGAPMGGGGGGRAEQTPAVAPRDILCGCGSSRASFNHSSALPALFCTPSADDVGASSRLELPAATMRALHAEAAVMAGLRHPCVVQASAALRTGQRCVCGF